MPLSEAPVHARVLGWCVCPAALQSLLPIAKAVTCCTYRAALLPCLQASIQMLQSVGVTSPPLIGIGSPAQQALDIHTAMQVGLLQQCLSLAFRSLEASTVWNVQQGLGIHPAMQVGEGRGSYG